MEMKHRSVSTKKTEEERHGEWSRWDKGALESCGLWSSHGKEKPLPEVTEDEGQVWSLRYEDRAVQEDYTMCGIGAVCGSRSALKKVCELKGTHTNLRRGAEELHQLVGKLRYLRKELDALRTRASDPEELQKRREQDVVLSLLVSLKSSYGQLIMQEIKDEEQADVDELCDLIQAAYEVHEKNKKRIKRRMGTKCKKTSLRRLSRMSVENRLAMSRSESSWRPTGSRSESFQKLTMSRSEGSWRLTGSRSESFREKRRCRFLAKKYSSMIRCRKRVVGVCNYSAYMGETLGDNVDTRRADECVTKKEWIVDTKRADERVTKKEWDEFVKYVYALATTRSLGAPAKASAFKPIIIDSGATHHMISDKRLISDVKAAGSVEMGVEMKTRK